MSINHLLLKLFNKKLLKYLFLFFRYIYTPLISSLIRREYYGLQPSFIITSFGLVEFVLKYSQY